MRLGTERSAEGVYQRALLVVPLLILAFTGCESRPAPEAPSGAESQEGVTSLAPLGRIYPNLVYEYDLGKSNEFQVKLEIDVHELGESGPETIARLLKQVEHGSIVALDSLEALVHPMMGEDRKPPRQAFKEMVHCAFFDHRVRLKDKDAQTNCPDALPPGYGERPSQPAE